MISPHYSGAIIEELVLDDVGGEIGKLGRRGDG